MAFDPACDAREVSRAIRQITAIIPEFACCCRSARPTGAPHDLHRHCKTMHGVSSIPIESLGQPVYRADLGPAYALDRSRTAVESAKWSLQ